MPQSIFYPKIDYFFRLAREVGYWQFLYRYLLRGFHKITKINQRMTLYNQTKMMLPHDSRFGTEIFLKRNKLDWGSEAILTHFLDPQKSFIDIGANIGYYSLLAAPSSKEVYSFEPDPRLTECLEKNLSQFQNCRLIKEALYSEPGIMEFSLSSMPELNSLVRYIAEGSKIQVKVNTLDAWMTEDELLDVNIGCIKIDAEGADFEILLGGKNLLVRDQPLVLLEAYPNSKLLKFAKSINFACFGFVKPKDVRLSHLPPRLIKIEETPANYRLKMIFMVPQRLWRKFEELVHLNGSKLVL